MNKTLEELLINLPELTAGKGLWNCNHEFDVYEHTIRYVAYLKTVTYDTDIIVAGYFHDIAKPVVKKAISIDGTLKEKAPGVPSYCFPEHEKVGEQMVRAMPEELFTIYNLNQDRIARLVGAHYLPLQYIKKMRQTTSYSDFVSEFNNLSSALDATGLARYDIMTMFLADCLSKGNACTAHDEFRLASDILIMPNGNADMLNRLYNLQKSRYGNKS